MKRNDRLEHRRGEGVRIHGNFLGASLIELMVSTLVFSFVAAGGMKFLVLQHQWAVHLEDSADAQQQVRAALDFMERELGLLGSGLPEDDLKIQKAAEQEVAFLANLHSAVARLTETAENGQTRLYIRYENGSDQFRQGKTVSICSLDHCERHVLARDGGAAELELDPGVTRDFGPRSTIQIINQVRYALRPADGMQFKLIRTVDGGANPVAEGLSGMELIYLDGAGRMTSVLADIRRIKIHLAARTARSPDHRRSLEAEIFLKNG